VTLELYNTLTRRQEPFVPLNPPRVTLYTCGPTIWNFAHIGNFRTFLFEDLLRRWLEATGHDVYHIMNLTDVDDRIIKEAGARSVGIRDFTAPFATAFFEDRDYLRIRPAHEYPRATDFIGPMIRLVEGLLQKGVAYRGEDNSIYFSIERFPAYGKLSMLDRRELKAGASARVSTDEYAKEDARDFALWKAARPEDEAVQAAWDAPFGRGRPGWHLECSAMALELIDRKYGVDRLDIHAGAVDLIFPHHEDEIAQSCAYTGRPEFARVWMHGEFLNVRGTKMSKRFGNYVTPRDLRADGVDPGAVRLLMFQTHYRQKLDLTDDALAAAREGARRLGEFARRLEERASSGTAEAAAMTEAAGRLRRDFTAALNDDLNAPRAVGHVFEFVTEANRLMDQGVAAGAETLSVWRLVDSVLDATTAPRVIQVTPRVPPVSLEFNPPTFGVTPNQSGDESPLSESPPGDEAGREEWARQWAERRAGAKARREFAEADRIRQILGSHGFEVRDTRGGTEVVRK
jgi:cysteinyl-tRNA synthetase